MTDNDWMLQPIEDREEFRRKAEKALRPMNRAPRIKRKNHWNKVALFVILLIGAIYLWLK